MKHAIRFALLGAAAALPAHAQDQRQEPPWPFVEVCVFNDEVLVLPYTRSDTSLAPLGEWAGGTLSENAGVLMLVRGGLVIQAGPDQSVRVVDGAAQAGICVNATGSLQEVLDTLATEQSRALVASNDAMFTEMEVLRERVIDHDELQADHAELQAERDNLTGQLARVRQDRVELRTERVQLQRELAGARSEFAEVQGVRDALQREVDRLGQEAAEVADFRERQVEIMRYRDSLIAERNGLRDTLAEVRSQLQQCQAP